MSITTKDFRDSNGKWSKGFTAGGVQYQTKLYTNWCAMKSRCKVKGGHQRRLPTYVGCYMSEGFKDFQFYAEWYTTQIGYGESDYQLDKDFLVPGNKCYGEDYCVLLPRHLNVFPNDSRNVRGEFPQGVSFQVARGQYRTQINREGKVCHVGLYPTPELAAEAYRLEKNKEAARWYARLVSGEFVIDPRVVEIMSKWEFVEKQAEVVHESN